VSTAITDEQWLATFDLNFHAARRMSRAAVPAMLAGGGGSLVYISSDSARLPEIGNLDYAAAKLPLLALSTSLATEFQPAGHPLERRGARTHPHPAVRPAGWLRRAGRPVVGNRQGELEIRPLLTSWMGQPDDIAQVVAYLVSPLSRQVTAAEWNVDGGALRQI